MNHDEDEAAQERELPQSQGGPSSYKITLPEFREKTSFYDYENEIEDYEALEEVTRATNAARLALFKVTEEINDTERTISRVKLAYDRKYKRVYLARDTVKPDSARRMTAEIACESIEDKLVVAEQYKSELTRIGNSLRLELQSLQGIGNNIRQQMRH